MTVESQCGTEQELNGWHDTKFRYCENPLKKELIQKLQENPRPYCELTKKGLGYFED